jgi:hypothetical protein
VRALVVGQHIATPEHVMTFTEEFYKALAAGESVEQAVQLTRRQLLRTSPVWPQNPSRRDKAAFGAVSVVTTAEGDVRLLDLPVVDAASTDSPSGMHGQPQPGRGAPTSVAPPAAQSLPPPRRGKRW